MNDPVMLNVFSHLYRDINGKNPGQIAREGFLAMSEEGRKAEMAYLNSIIVALRAEAFAEKKIQAQRDFGPKTNTNPFAKISSN